MTLPRSKYVRDGEEGVYHCYTRCVRRAFLCGYDPVTGRDFSHRKALIVKRLEFLASIFAIDVCAYSVMETHLHDILRLRPDLASAWSDHEVATRWLTLYPRKKKIPLEIQISALSSCPGRIAKLRRRLSSLSWFMGRLNEHIARLANKEDDVKGHFWESRFKCQALLDDAAIAACMAYVDLNPIRAGQAATPEESDFTSIQERIRAWGKLNLVHDAIPSDSIQNNPSVSSNSPIQQTTNEADGFNSLLKSTPTLSSDSTSAHWLCPIQSTPLRRGILPMTEAEYFDLVDRSGRILRTDKRGAMDPNLAPILLRIGARPEAWTDTVSHFGSRFHLAAGLISSLRRFADQIGSRWLTGIKSARAAFAANPNRAV